MRLRDILRGKNATNYEGEDFSTEFENDKPYKVSLNFPRGSSPSALVGQAFGAGQEYNDSLAQSIIDARSYFKEDVPAYVQTEIGNGLKNIGGENYFSFGTIYKENEKSETFSKISAKEIILNIKRKLIGDSLNLENVVYITHPALLFRAKEIGKNMGLDGGFFIPYNVTWIKNDPQKWVRDPKSWKNREIITRIHHWVSGWVPREL